MSLISTYQSRKSLFAEKLITKGVEASASDGLTTLINKIDDIQGGFTEGVLLYADKKIAQSGDDVNLYALLLEDDKAVIGETVRFYADRPLRTISINEMGVSLGDDYWVSTSSTTMSAIGRGGSIGYIQFNSSKIQIYTSSWSPDYYYKGKFHICDNVLTYTDTNDEIQTIDLTGVSTEYSYGANVSFTVDYYWEDAVTGSDGVANYEYGCSGLGNINFYATYGNFVSETFGVIDGTFFDKGILNDPQTNDGWSLNSTTRTRTNEYTELKHPTEVSQSTTFQTRLLDGNLTIEFDYYCTNVDEHGISIRKDSTVVVSRSLSHLNVPINTWCHIKWILKNGEYFIYVDGVDKTPPSHSLGEYTHFFFRVNKTYIIRYENFVIYPI